MDMGTAQNSDEWTCTDPLKTRVRHFQNEGGSVLIKRSHLAHLLSSLYCYLIGDGDCIVGMGKESGNGHLINSFPRRRQQSTLTMSYHIEQDSCQRFGSNMFVFSRPSLLLLS